MPRRSSQILPGPIGYASYIDPSLLPLDKCQLLKGWFPARYGILRQTYQMRPVVNFTFSVVAVAVYYSTDGLHDKLLVVRSNTTTTYAQLYSTPLTGAFGYNAYNGNQHVTLTLPAFTLVGAVFPAGSSPNGYRFVQFEDELIIMSQDTGEMYRYWVSSSGTQNLYPMNIGLGTINTPALLDGGAGGNLSAGTYKYLVASVDERGREQGYTLVDSANLALTITLAASHKVTVGSAGGANPGGGFSMNLYRTVANGAAYLFVRSFVAADLPFTDNTADASLGAAYILGNTDPPATATFGCVYQDRLVLNDVAPYPTSASTADNLNKIQLSNSDRPTQFSTVSANAASGLTLNVGSDTGDIVTGLANLGSLAVVTMGRSIKMLQGTDNASFQTVEVQKKGCLNHSSLCRCDNVVPFLAQDGVWEFGYQSGFAIQPLSSDIRDYFDGFADLVGNGNENNFQSIIMASATTGYMSSFYLGRRFFLSLPMETLCYDFTAGGWSQTGWGLISSAAVYNRGGGPECAFVLPRGPNASTKPKTLYWINSLQEPSDPDALPVSNATKISRPFDGEGPAKARRKRNIKYWLFGSSDQPKGTVIGTATFTTDSGFSFTANIKAYITIGTGADALWVYEPPQACVGRQTQVIINITDPTCQLEQDMMEYSDYDSDG